MQSYNQENLTNVVFEFVFECAMRVAISQRAFKGKKDWIRKVSEAQSSLREYIDKLFKNKFNSQTSHDKCFLKTVNSICKSINDKKPADVTDTFSFGNAQKLVNMTVKYLYIVCFHDPELRSKFEFCHCPLDSILLDTVWKRIGEIHGKKMRVQILGKHEVFCASWGDEELNEGGNQPNSKTLPKRYATFQNAIRMIIGDGTLYPIEFDYLNWNQ